MGRMGPPDRHRRLHHVDPVEPRPEGGGLMPTSAIVTAIIVGLVLYGGFFWCVRIAIRKSREEASRGDAE
ncbi:MAG: MetS family NSS transporter small subunit [Candidatus Eisenbacteria bacterium]|nr:MetS family NSS transporter small subunit [Candidatus Eisenbacteria bacterium]